MCFRFIQVALICYRTGDLPQHDHAHVEGLSDEENAIQIQPASAVKGGV